MYKILVTFFILSNHIPLYTQKIISPSSTQLGWHDMEYYMFAHFGPNTFTNLEWGQGNENNDIFNPKNLDCEQWCQTAKAAGAAGIIITAKHHDGFCLWPSKYSNHTVAQSIWRQGKGDILKELSEACKKYKLKFGIYISPWDRNHPDYGTDHYNDVFISMMAEILDAYGPIWELWWDGANGEGTNGKKQVYDWQKYISYVKNKSPNTLIFSDVGPDIRWVGNENGIAGLTNWNTLDTETYSPGLGAPPNDTLSAGNVKGKHWIPSECDVSIRPGWFYHAEEDDKVKSPEFLFDLYLKSVGRGANLLINVPPDRHGLIHIRDSLSLIGFKKLIDSSFSTDKLFGLKPFFGNHSGKSSINPLTDQNDETYEILKSDDVFGFVINKVAEEVNCLVLKEYLKFGQSVASFIINFYDENDQLIHVEEGNTIGHKRILTFPSLRVKKFNIKIKANKPFFQMNSISAYKISDTLVKS